MMAIPTLISAILLIVVGVMGYAQQAADAKSPTALIPAAIGGVLAVCGLLAFNDKARKHAMHFAAVVGLVGMLGGFMPLIRQYKKTGAFDPLKPSAASGELMILICAIFLGLCVSSFIQAKKARKAKEAAEATGTSAPPA
jgi:F0F1-type ATP synthase assembly protein I